MYIRPRDTQQTVNNSPLLVWVEDYRKLSPPDRLEFAVRFSKQEFGFRKKKYGRSSFLKWVGTVPISPPPLEVAKWCTIELKKIHTQIAALGKGEVVE